MPGGGTIVSSKAPGRFAGPRATGDSPAWAQSRTLPRGVLAVAVALVIRPILRERMRTLLTLAGIAVGVAVVVAIQLANQSALRAFRESVDSIAGRANYQVIADAGTLDERILLRFQPLWREDVRFAPVIDTDGFVVSTGQPIRLLGVDLLSDLHFRDYRYARISVGSRARQAPGGMTAASLASYLDLFEPGSVILPLPYAREHRLDIGSPLAIDVGGRSRTMVVRGILEARGPATAFNGAIAICDIATAQEAFGLAGKLSRIDVLVPDAGADRVLTRIRRQLPPGTRLERPSRRNERVEKMLRAFRVNLFALAGVALLVGMFLVYNTVLISILRRRRDVGIAKMIGVTPGQIFGAFLCEGLVFGAVGSAAGLGLGYAMARGILSLIGRTVNALYVTSAPEAVSLTPGVVALGLAVGIALSLIAAVQPSIEAARTLPATLVRSGLQQRLAPLRTRFLAAIAALSFAIAAAATRLPQAGGVAIAGYVSVLFVVAGFSFLSPAIVRAAAVLAAPPLRRTFGIVGRLAAASLPASLRRTSVATAAFAIAIGMMVAVALMVGSFRVTVNAWIDQTVSSDLWLRPSKNLTNAGTAVFPDAMIAEVRRVPFVAAVDPVRGRDVIYGESLIAVGSSDFRVAAAHGTLPMIAPRSARAALDSARRTGGVLVSESFAFRFDKRLGDEIVLPAARGSMRVRIAGIYRDYSNDRGTVVMDRQQYIRAYDDSAVNTLVIYLRPGADLESARTRLESLFGAKYHAFAVTNASIRKQVMTIFDQTFLITYALLGVAIVVGVLGIVNTLAALILERRRELALLRVGGMTAGEVRTMLLLESALIGAAATASGVVMGYVLSWILINVINLQSFGWTIEFHTPWLLLVLSLATTFAASCVAGLVPARLASSIDIASAIKAE